MNKELLEAIILFNSWFPKEKIGVIMGGPDGFHMITEAGKDFMVNPVNNLITQL